MNDDAPRWFDDDTEPTGRPRRFPTLVVVAVVPWVVLALVLFRGSAPDGPDDDAADLAASRDDDHPSHAVPPAADPADPAGPDLDTDPAGEHAAGDGTHHAPIDDAPEDGLGAPPQDARHDALGALDHPTRVAHGVAEALVVAITRAWLSDAGPDLELEGVEVDRSGYLEHVAVERITLADATLAVATVTVVVLDRDGDRYADATVRRAAVPLRVTETTVHPAGQPWWLPSALDLTSRPPELVAVDDDDVTAAVDAALETAGYRDATVDELAATADGTVVATVTAATADGVPIRSGVWLRLDPDGGATVLGHHDDDTT